MHNTKRKIGNCGLLHEANRTLYMDENGEYIEGMSHSKIDFKRTQYNYNLSENDYTREDIISLNEKWRGCKLNEKKDNAMCDIVITLPQDFSMPGHEILTTLVGKERMEYILSHDDVKAAVDTFMVEGKKSLMKLYGLSEEDIVSAWVHYDESNPHCHLYYIPHVHETVNTISEKDKDKVEELQKQLELSENPKEFYEDTRMKYENKILRCEERLSETKTPAQKQKIEKTLKATKSDLEKLLARGGNEKEIKKWAQDSHRNFKSKLKKLTSETVKETVSVDKCVTRDKLLKMHDIVSDDISAALGFRVEMRTEKTLGYDPQKYTKEEKEKALQAKAEKLQAEAEKAFSKAETEQAQKLADKEIEKYASISMQVEQEQQKLVAIQTEQQSSETKTANAKAEYERYRAFIQKDHDYTQYPKSIAHPGKRLVTETPDLDFMLASMDNVKILEKEKAEQDIKISALEKTIDANKDTIYSKNREIDKYKSQYEYLKSSISVTLDDIEKAYKNPYTTNRELSEMIKHYAIVQNNRNTDSILKICIAMDKIDAYKEKSYRQRNKVGTMEMVDNPNFRNYDRYDRKIRDMLKKSLKYEGRTEIYQNSELKNLWLDIQGDNRLFWEKKKLSHKEEYQGYISIDRVFTAIIPGLIQAAIQAIRSYIDMIRQAQKEEHER